MVRLLHWEIIFNDALISNLLHIMLYISTFLKESGSEVNVDEAWNDPHLCLAPTQSLFQGFLHLLLVFITNYW